MDPFSAGTLAMISMAGSAGSAGLGAYGAMRKGAAGASMHRYQAGLAMLNKKIAMQNADYSRYVGEVDAHRVGVRTSQMIGKQMSQQGASNLDVAGGSAAQVRASQLAVGQADAGTVRANAARRAWGYEIEGVQHTASAEMHGRAAEDASSSGYLGAIGSILGGVTSVADKWYRWDALTNNKGSVYGSTLGGGARETLGGMP